MDDKILIIIFCGINLIMWVMVLDYMRKMKAAEIELRKRTETWEKKTCDYYHQAYTHIVEMTDINLKAQDEFLNRISVKIDSGENITCGEKSGANH